MLLNDLGFLKIVFYIYKLDANLCNLNIMVMHEKQKLGLAACVAFSEQAAWFCSDHCEIPILLKHQIKDKDENVYRVINLVGLLAKSFIKGLWCHAIPLISSHLCISIKALEQKETAWKFKTKM